MRRAQDGDGHAYEALLSEVGALVKAYARRHLRRDDGLDDIVQETLLAIHRNRHTYDPGRAFGPWMYAIARHRLIDVVRVERRRRRHDALEMERMEDLRVHAAVEPARPSGFIERALALLTTRQRDVIHMLKVEGRSVDEIATKTGMSQSLVKVTAHRGYKRLRRVLGRRGDDE